MGRKPTTILAADTSAYSFRIDDGDADSIRKLNACRKVFLRYIARARGGVFGDPEDAVFAEFRRPRDALYAAVKIQQAIRGMNARDPRRRQLRFRIGIEAGPVSRRGGLIFGDAVDGAARLAGVALAEGICISEAVRGDLRPGMGLAISEIEVQPTADLNISTRALSVGYDGGTFKHRLTFLGALPGKFWRFGRGCARAVGYASVVLCTALVLFIVSVLSSLTPSFTSSPPSAAVARDPTGAVAATASPSPSSSASAVGTEQVRPPTAEPTVTAAIATTPARAAVDPPEPDRGAGPPPVTDAGSVATVPGEAPTPSPTRPAKSRLPHPSRRSAAAGEGDHDPIKAAIALGTLFAMGISFLDTLNKLQNGDGVAHGRGRHPVHRHQR